MKIFIIAGLLLIMASPYRCAEDNEEINEEEMTGGSYEAQDVEARNAIANWEKFLVQSDLVVDDACVKISQATDKLENGPLKNKGRQKSAIIKAEAKMEKLSDMLLVARKIKTENYRFNEPALRDIECFKDEFKSKQEELNEALKKLETR